MGKVYDALNRANNKAEEPDLFDDIDAEDRDDSLDLELEPDQEDAGAEEPSSERFHFMRYSLGVTSLVAQPRSAARPAAALVPRSAPAGRELTIDRERLDPHLVTYNSLDPAGSQEYNKLALSLVSRSAEKGFKRVLIASAVEGEGRTS